MKLSILIPTFNSGETIERTLRAVVAQSFRPLEIVLYDEASKDGTPEIVQEMSAHRSSAARLA